MQRGKHLLLLCLLLVTGCTHYSPVIDTRFYAPLPEVLPQLSDHAYLREKIDIGDVQVSLPNQIAAQSLANFKEGLVAALSQAKLLGGEHSFYILDANIKDSQRLELSGSKEVLTSVEYSLREKKSGRVVYQETLNVPYDDDIHMTEARAKLAQMGIIPGSHEEEINLIRGYRIGSAFRENITQLLRILSAKTKSDLTQIIS